MRHRGIGAVLLALPLSAAAFSVGTERAAAGVSPYREGADGVGAILTGDSGVEIERAHLLLTLDSFPDGTFGDADGFFAYGGRFTAEYTFLNNSEEDATLRLVLPFGALPDYAPWDRIQDAYAPERYTVTENGRPVECTLRHTYNENGFMPDRFDPEVGLARLYPAPRSFYGDDLPVHVYTYELQAAAEGGSGANFALSFEGSGKSRIFCSEHFNFSVRDGRGKLSHYFDCTGEPQTFTVYVLGEDILDIQTEIFRYRDGVAEIAERAAATLRSEERMTFSALAESLHTLSAVNVEDWKNALVEHIEKGRFPDAAVSNATPRDLEACFMPWYEYSLTVPAGGRTVSAVSSPIYPTVENTHSQLLYRYTYTLNPAQCWSKFGTLTIDIDTPYYLSESSLLGFTAREGGYTLTREKLPLGDLSFTLSAEERIEDGKNAYTDREDDAPLITAIVILGTVFAAAVTVVIVLTVQSRKRKRRREEEERRLMQARAKEGKIDI